ncbi:outer membrane lipoprotein-sorting protein [Ramlibacter sp. MMS24-I3-19]|uniref:outer membrane lipoprotein-sorting protein n=1 Tax=Ramlibacter sp. MMS24-I3-19 TaxID=3416606 RepID=UPI003D00576B
MKFNAKTAAVLLALGLGCAHAETVKPKITRALGAEQAKAALAARKLPPRPLAEPTVGPRADLPALDAEEIVARNVQARGGAANWAAIHAISYEGRMDAGQARVDGGNVATTAKQHRVERRLTALKEAPPPEVIQLPYRLDLQKPHRMRLEIPFAGQTAVQVYDGQHGWKVRPYLGRKEAEPFTPDEMRAAAGDEPLDGPLIGHAAKGVRVALDGTEMVEGRGTYRLRITLPGGEQRRVWVDGQTFLEAKVEGSPRRFDGKLRPVVTYLRDWRAESGVQVAHLMETRVEGTRQNERLVVESVRVNPPLEPSRFEKPL